MNGAGAEAFVHRYVPPNAGGPRVTMLLLHGTGGGEDDLIPLGRALAPGAGLLSPRGKVLENGMPRFFRRLAEGVFDLDDLVARTQELAAFVEAASARYGFDPRHVVAAGFSNGANIAASLLFLHPGLLWGAILYRPMVPVTPSAAPDLSGIPVFIGAGKADPLVAPAETGRLAAMLRSWGAVVAVHWEPGGHGLTAGDIAAAAAWLSGSLAATLGAGTPAPPG